MPDDTADFLGILLDMTAQKEKGLLQLLDDILETKGMIAIADAPRAA